MKLALYIQNQRGSQNHLSRIKQLHTVQQQQFAVQIGSHQGNRHLASIIQREGEDEASNSLVLSQVSSEATSENASVQSQAQTGSTEAQSEAD